MTERKFFAARFILVALALFAFSGFLTLSGIMLADLLYVAADPRIKLS